MLTIFNGQIDASPIVLRNLDSGTDKLHRALSLSLTIDHLGRMLYHAPRGTPGCTMEERTCGMHVHEERLLSLHPLTGTCCETYPIGLV